MRIGHRPAFVFLSNPKCGSSSIRAVLTEHSDILGERHPAHPIEMTHINACALKSYFEHEDYKNTTVGPWEDYYKFTTVRNPWEKMVSYFFFYKPDKNMKAAVLAPKDYDTESAFSVGFNAWLKYVIDGQGLPHYEYFCCDHDSNELLLDDVFKIEEINDVLPSALLDHLSIEVNEIPKLNPDYTLPELEGKYTNWKGDYYSLYNNESKEIVSEVYKSDISNFNYKFGK